MADSSTLKDKVIAVAAQMKHNLLPPSYENILREQDPKMYSYIYTKPQKPLDRALDKYHDILKGAGKKVWRGMLAVGASGFGKGLIITALVVVAVTAMVTGFDAWAYNAPFEKGFVSGITHGINFLTGNGFGWATLAFGGAMGAVSEVRKEQNKLTAHMAETQALDYEIARQLQQQAALTPAVVATETRKPWDEPGFVAREEQRRVEIQQTGNGGRVIN